MNRPLSYWRERAKALDFRERDDPVMGSWQEYLRSEMCLADLQAQVERLTQERDTAENRYRQAVEEGGSVLDQYEEANAHLEAAEDTIEEQHTRTTVLESERDEAIKRGTWLWHYTWRRHLFMLGAEVLRTDEAERQRDEARVKLVAVEGLAKEASCPLCIEKPDEACTDDGCNWGRLVLAILRGSE